METLTHEWVAKAEGDFTCVQREWQVRKAPVSAKPSEKP
jgi:hypothetical protein